MIFSLVPVESTARSIRWYRGFLPRIALKEASFINHDWSLILFWHSLLPLHWQLVQVQVSIYNIGLFYRESQNGWGWKGPLEITWSTTLLRQSHLEPLAQLSVSPRMKTTQPLCAASSLYFMQDIVGVLFRIRPNSVNSGWIQSTFTSVSYNM